MRVGIAGFGWQLELRDLGIRIGRRNGRNGLWPLPGPGRIRLALGLRCEDSCAGSANQRGQTIPSIHYFSLAFPCSKLLTGLRMQSTQPLPNFALISG
jgi:hypothetical protein